MWKILSDSGERKEIEAVDITLPPFYAYAFTVWGLDTEDCDLMK
jgi:hypothetical protein